MRKSLTSDLDETRRANAEGRRRRARIDVSKLLHPPTQEEAWQARRREAEEAEAERLARVKRLAPEAKKAARAADQAADHLAECRAAHTETERNLNEANTNWLRLTDRRNRLEVGDDV